LYKIQIPERKIHHMQYAVKPTAETFYDAVTSTRVIQYCCCYYYITIIYTVSQKKGPTLKRYSSKLYGSILMIFGGNIQKSLE